MVTPRGRAAVKGLYPRAAANYKVTTNPQENFAIFPNFRLAGAASRPPCDSSVHKNILARRVELAVRKIAFITPQPQCALFVNPCDNMTCRRSKFPINFE